MIKSMTGYGTSEAVGSGKKLTVEIKSVNHRYNDITVKTPRNYGYLEDAVRKTVAAAVSRGKIDVYVSCENDGDDETVVTPNISLAKGYYNAVSEIKKELGLRDEISINHVIRFSDVFSVERADDKSEEIIKLAVSVAADALASFTAMREVEGKKLYDDMMGQLNSIESFVHDIEVRSPQIVSEYKGRIESRMRELLDGVAIDEGRLLNEVAIYADRVNVNEEIIRLKSHISQVRQLLGTDEPIGRKLDFIIQEMNREINTIGSKSNDLEVARIVIDVKATIEKLREQVQNIE